VERTHSWLNDFGRLRRCTERRRPCVEAYLALATAIVILRALLRAAWPLYRWATRPRTRRIRWPIGGRPNAAFLKAGR